jgi:hypothetical protein
MAWSMHSAAGGSCRLHSNKASPRPAKSERCAVVIRPSGLSDCGLAPSTSGRGIDEVCWGRRNLGPRRGDLQLVCSQDYVATSTGTQQQWLILSGYSDIHISTFLCPSSIFLLLQHTSCCCHSLAAAADMLSLALHCAVDTFDEQRLYRAACDKTSSGLSICCADEGVLKLPPRTELDPSQITHVYGKRVHPMSFKMHVKDYL